MGIPLGGEIVSRLGDIQDINQLVSQIVISLENFSLKLLGGTIFTRKSPATLSAIVCDEDSTQLLGRVVQELSNIEESEQCQEIAKPRFCDARICNLPKNSSLKAGKKRR